MSSEERQRGVDLFNEVWRLMETREDNDRMLRVLTIHEAVPGHYLQGVYSNRCDSLPRTILWSGVFAEGWAVYVTQVMMDAGYGAESIDGRFAHVPILQKPIERQVLQHLFVAPGNGSLKLAWTKPEPPEPLYPPAAAVAGSRPGVGTA